MPLEWDGLSLPRSLEIVAMDDENQSPSISWDCTTMYFQSNRPGTLGLHDIYVSTRKHLSRKG